MRRQRPGRGGMATRPLGRGLAITGLSLIAVCLGRFSAFVGIFIYLPLLDGAAGGGLLRPVLIWSEAALLVWITARAVWHRPLLRVPLTVFAAAVTGFGALLALSLSELRF